MPCPKKPNNNTGNNPATDIPLYCAARFSPYTLSEITSGTDIYVKSSPGKSQAVYLLHWTGRRHECIPLPADCAVRLLRGLAVMPDTAKGIQYANIKKWLPEFFTRDRRARDAIFFQEDELCGMYFEYFRKGSGLPLPEHD